MEMTKSREERLNRVKVYLLSDIWLDKGTGYCFGEVFDDQSPYLVVRNELNDEDQLLKAKIEGSTQFQRQQDTLIVWTDPDGQSIALSFQEKEGCSSMCDFIVHVHETKLAPQITLMSVISNEIEGDITEMIVGPIEYPPPDPTLKDLQHILNCFNAHTNSLYYRGCVFKFIEQNDYIHKLIRLFQEAETKKQIKNLHILCHCIKALLAHDEAYVLRLMDDDDYMIGLAGILEYDPEFPQYKANHRKMLQDESNFKELLPVNDPELTRLIRKTAKLQFLKDVVLVRLLEDPSYSVLNQKICMNQGSILENLEAGEFIDELFKMYTDGAEASIEQKRQGIKLLNQFVLTAKNLPMKLKTKFFQSLVKKGLLKTVEFVLNHGSVESRVSSLEIIVTIISHDMLLISNVSEDSFSSSEESVESVESVESEPNKVEDVPKRRSMLDELDHTPFDGDDYEKEDDNVSLFQAGKTIALSNDMSLMTILTRFLLEGKDPGVRMQAFEALKALLDPVANVNTPRFLSDESRAEKLDTTAYFTAFYEQVAPKLFGPLITLDENNTVKDYERDNMFISLCELVNFCSADRGASRSFFMENNILRGISLLVRPHHKLQLRLTAIRSLKSLITLNDDYYTRTIIAEDLLKEVFGLLESLHGSPELSYSTILDLLEIVLVGIEKGNNRKNFKLLANYIVERYRPCLEAITDVNSGNDLTKSVDNDGTSLIQDGDPELDDDQYSNDDILTEPLQEEDSMIHAERLKDSRILLDINTPEKRVREDENVENDHSEDTPLKKKSSTLKQKFTNAGKKLVSKFGNK